MLRAFSRTARQRCIFTSEPGPGLGRLFCGEQTTGRRKKKEEKCDAVAAPPPEVPGTSQSDFGRDDAAAHQSLQLIFVFVRPCRHHSAMRVGEGKEKKEGVLHVPLSRLVSALVSVLKISVLCL